MDLPNRISITGPNGEGTVLTSTEQAAVQSVLVPRAPVTAQAAMIPGIPLDFNQIGYIALGGLGLLLFIFALRR
jgi:hypothetical protein